MKRQYLIGLLSVLVTAPCTFATDAPLSLRGHIVEISFNGAIERSYHAGDTPDGLWKDAISTALIIQFPESADKFEAPFPGASAANPRPPFRIVYTPDNGKNTASITISAADMNADITLSFDSATGGNARLTWQEEESITQQKGMTFSIRPAKSTDGKLTLPLTSEDEGALTLVDDGVVELCRELELRTYKNAVEKLYQKRLLTLLPRIMEGADINSVLPNANNSTALHYACGLSHPELVQWLVDHGADLSAKTAKGASVDDCVGGPNAKAIRTILRKARSTSETLPHR